MNENEIGKEIVDSAVKIHKELGPGLLESVYEIIMAMELRKRGLSVERQVVVPFEYDGVRFDEGFRADLVVDKKVIIELKSVQEMNPAHLKQLLTYLKLMDLRLGFLLNFGVALMRDGIKRIVHGLEEQTHSVTVRHSERT